MKIKDLITKLQTFDPELEVIIMDSDGYKGRDIPEDWEEEHNNEYSFNFEGEKIK